MKNIIVKARHKIKDNNNNFIVVSGEIELGKTNTKDEAFNLAAKFIRKGYSDVKIKANKQLIDND